MREAILGARETAETTFLYKHSKNCLSSRLSEKCHAVTLRGLKTIFRIKYKGDQRFGILLYIVMSKNEISNVFLNPSNL